MSLEGVIHKSVDQNVKIILHMHALKKVMVSLNHKIFFLEKLLL